MKPRQLLLSAITTLLMATAGGQGATAQTLQVHHADGTTTDHVLGTGTKMLFQDDRVLLASPSQTLNFAKSDVLAFTYHYSKYDLNGDNVIDKKDLTSVVEMISSLNSLSRREADVNGDGVANIGDIIDVISVMANGEKSVATYTPTLGSGTIGDAFFIYRNDGQFNAFFREETDSIVFSHFDAEGNRYNKIASQVVYTADSTYMIPLVAIDSLGFVTPATEYKPGVIPLVGNVRDYIVSSDSLTVFFRLDTPSIILPRIGDKLVTEEISDVFPYGFIGQVESIETIDGKMAFHCSKVDFEDVFEYYYYVTQGDVNASSRRVGDGEQLIVNSWERTFSPGTLNFPLTNYVTPNIYPAPAGDLAVQVENHHNVSFTPTFKVKFARIVSPKLGTVVSLDLSEEDAITEELSMSGSIKWTHDFDAIDIPLVELGIPFLWLYGRAGAFVSADATVSMEQRWQQNYRYTFHLEAGSRDFYIPRASLNGIQLTNDHGGQAMLKGEVSLGIFAELGVEFADRNIASVAYRGELGISIGGEAILYKKDIENALHSTDVYKALQGTGVYLKGFYRTGLPVKRLWFGWDNEHKKGEKVFARANLVPNFSDTKLERDKEQWSTLFASSKVKGTCFPVDLGFTLLEQQSTNGKTSYVTTGYTGASAELYSSFFDMSTSKKYEVYPTVKLMGIEMLAEPKGEEKEETSCPDSNHPHMIDLGLPSGTKWACCNVGASTPEGYGNYYAWGETSPKSVYDWNAYQYLNIGSDIAGTGYDAATANWGSPWRMPSLTQIQELLRKTTSTWTTQNGVNGRKFTGSNGGTVFLPAAGYRRDDELFLAGSNGYFWSSTLDEGNWGSAYGFFLFYSGYADWYLSGRDGLGSYVGQSVRPVR